MKQRDGKIWQKTADFLIESIVFCPLVPPSWISLVDPTSAMYASAIYVSYIYGLRRALPPDIVKLSGANALIGYKLTVTARRQ